RAGITAGETTKFTKLLLAIDAILIVAFRTACEATRTGQSATIKSAALRPAEAIRSAIAAGSHWTAATHWTIRAHPAAEAHRAIRTGSSAIAIRAALTAPVKACELRARAKAAIAFPELVMSAWAKLAWPAKSIWTTHSWTTTEILRSALTVKSIATKTGRTLMSAAAWTACEFHWRATESAALTLRTAVTVISSLIEILWSLESRELWTWPETAWPATSPIAGTIATIVILKTGELWARTHTEISSALASII